MGMASVGSSEYICLFGGLPIIYYSMKCLEHSRPISESNFNN